MKIKNPRSAHFGVTIQIVDLGEFESFKSLSFFGKTAALKILLPSPLFTAMHFLGSQLLHCTCS